MLSMAQVYLKNWIIHNSQLSIYFVPKRLPLMSPQVFSPQSLHTIPKHQVACVQSLFKKQPSDNTHY